MVMESHEIPEDDAILDAEFLESVQRMINVDPADFDRQLEMEIRRYWNDKLKNATTDSAMGLRRIRVAALALLNSANYRRQ